MPIRIEPGNRPLIWLKTPPIQFGKTYDRAVCAQALGLATADLFDVTPQLASAGNPIIFIPVRDKRAVDRAWLDMSGMRAIHPANDAPVCIFVFTPTAEGAYSRMFAPELGVIEDPATGSATGPLAAYMLRNGLVPREKGSRFISEQGTKMGRRSILHILIHGQNGADGIEVGGYVTPLVEATMTLPLAWARMMPLDPSSVNGLSTLSTFENTVTTDVPMSGSAAAHAQARNPATNAYSTISCPCVSWQILNFKIVFMMAGMMS